MPIVISHQPPMELLSRAGYYVGAGEERARQEEMQQRERMQIRGIESNLISQQLSYQQQMQRDAVNQQYDMQQMGAQQAHQQDMFDRQEQLREKLAEMRREERNDQLKMKLQSQNELSQTKFKTQLEWDQAKFFSGQASDVMDTIGQQLQDGMGFETEDDEKAYRDMLRQIREVRNNPTMRQIQKEQAVYELTQKMPIPTKRIPPTREQFESETVEVQNKHGQWERWGRDRNGTWRKETQDSAEDNSALDAEKQKSERMKQYADAKKLLTRTKKTLDGTETTFPSHEEIIRYLDEAEQFADPEKAAAREAEVQAERKKGPVSPYSGKRKMKYDPETGQLTEM